MFGAEVAYNVVLVSCASAGIVQDIVLTLFGGNSSIDNGKLGFSDESHGKEQDK